MAAIKCMHSARHFWTGSKSRRISKKSRRRIMLEVCSGCGMTLSKKEK